MSDPSSDPGTRSHRQRVDTARLALLERDPSSTLKEILTATLDLAEVMSGSQIGFFHFVEEDQTTLWMQAWSTNTTARMCAAEGAGAHYPVEQAGVWADCVRTGKPVVHNDYATLLGRKGMPTGHAQVTRELTVPVTRAGRVCAVLGVGNKPEDYDDKDVEDVATLADSAWDIAGRKRAEEALKVSEQALRVRQARLDLAVTSARLGLWDLDMVTNLAWRTLRARPTLRIRRVTADVGSRRSPSPCHPGRSADLRACVQGGARHRTLPVRTQDRNPGPPTKVAGGGR